MTMGTVNSWNRQPGDAPLKRCLVCGAFGTSILCIKHFEEHMAAFDEHTGGLFSALFKAWGNNPKFRKMLEQEVKKDGGKAKPA